MTKLNRNVLRKVARDALPELFEGLGFSEKINNELLNQIIEEATKQNEIIKKLIGDLIAYKLSKALFLSSNLRIHEPHRGIIQILKRMCQTANVDILELEKHDELIGNIPEKVKHNLLAEIRNIEERLKKLSILCY
ncbi:MAG: hypothetical protein J7K82_03605 [Thermoproteales archaeon]|nr:hypothetical protein [Thermoproteales archaeon]